jgi:hypothetical protein
MAPVLYEMVRRKKAPQALGKLIAAPEDRQTAMALIQKIFATGSDMTISLPPSSGIPIAGREG